LSEEIELRGADIAGAGNAVARRVRSAAPAPLAVSVPVAFLLLGVLISVFEHAAIDYPVVRALNAFAGQSQFVDRSLHALTTLVLLQGAVFISIIWYLWFAHPDLPARARLLAGTLTAAGAGIVSRALQLVLPSHLRPLHTPGLDFVLPIGVDPTALNHFNSFPSDHGAVFFGLAAVIYRLSPPLGMAAFAWAAVTDLARVYEGFHYLSDIVASVGLGVLLVHLVQNGPVHRLACRALALEQKHRAAFYMLAFLVTYQIASLFDDVRELGRGLARVALHHDPFGGG
jgi:undecaprenyl-diphosphatase